MAEKILMLALSPTMEEGTIAKWRKKEGDTISMGDVLCEVETDKAAMDYESVQEGTLLKILVPEGGSVEIEEPIGIIGHKGEDISGLLHELQGTPIFTPVSGTKEKEEISAIGDRPPQAAWIKASPLARALAFRSGIELGSIKGSGPGERIIKRDVAVAKGGETEKKQPLPLQPAELKTFKQEKIPISKKRKIIAERLSSSKFSAPHYYLTLSVVVDNLLTSRRKLNEGRDKKVSFNAFLIKFAAEAIKHHPVINSSWQEDGIVNFGTIDIGLAVAQPDGLITPVLRDCGSKGILHIDDELTTLVGKARNNQLTPEEYKGATFTISNLGSYGIEEFTAIINPPGSAILAVGTIKKEPVILEDNRPGTASIIRLTLSCDHRVIDGSVGAAFLKNLKDIMENPIQILY
ncbi:MAG: dihydrolipoamide acetyltransferase family protein [Spirochaetota bacterium]